MFLVRISFPSESQVARAGNERLVGNLMRRRLESPPSSFPLLYGSTALDTRCRTELCVSHRKQRETPPTTRHARKGLRACDQACRVREKLFLGGRIFDCDGTSAPVTEALQITEARPVFRGSEFPLRQEAPAAVGASALEERLRSSTLTTRLPLRSSRSLGASRT
jgi:hypothetical protein